jgi:hypothetical protein
VARLILYQGDPRAEQLHSLAELVVLIAICAMTAHFCVSSLVLFASDFQLARAVMHKLKAQCFQW